MKATENGFDVKIFIFSDGLIIPKNNQIILV